jgi:hypothetical protein
MKTRLAIALVGSTLALLLGGSGGRAAPVEIAWTDHWAPLTPRLHAQGYRSGNSPGLSFTTPFAATVQSPAGTATTVVAVNLTTVSSASSSRPDRISADYTLSLMLTDEVSNAWTIRLFHGQLSGSLWRGGSSLSARFLPTNPQAFFLGGNSYAVSFGSFARVGGAATQYTLDASIATVPAGRRASRAATAMPLGGMAASPLDNPVPAGGPVASPSAAPEPSTLVLSFLGLSALGGGAWWRRRKGRYARLSHPV